MLQLGPSSMEEEQEDKEKDGEALACKRDDFDILAYTLSAYQLLSVFSSLPSQKEPTLPRRMFLKRPFPGVIPKVYGVDSVVDWVRLLRSNFADIKQFVQDLKSQSNGPELINLLKSCTVWKALQKTKGMKNVLNVFENFELTALGISFTMDGSFIEFPDSPLKIPGIPGTVDAILSESERLGGQKLEADESTFIKSLIKTHGIPALRLSCLATSYFGPVWLFKRGKILSNPGCQRLTLMQMFFCLGNQKPFLLQEVEMRLWDVLRRHSRVRGCLFTDLLEVFEDLPWDELEALSPEEKAWFKLEAVPPTASSPVIDPLGLLDAQTSPLSSRSSTVIPEERPMADSSKRGLASAGSQSNPATSEEQSAKPAKPKRKGGKIQSGRKSKKKKVTVDNKDKRSMEENCEIETTSTIYSLTDGRPLTRAVARQINNDISTPPNSSPAKPNVSTAPILSPPKPNASAARNISEIAAPNLSSTNPDVSVVSPTRPSSPLVAESTSTNPDVSIASPTRPSSPLVAESTSTLKSEIDALRLTPSPNGRSIHTAIDIDALFSFQATEIPDPATRAQILEDQEYVQACCSNGLPSLFRLCSHRYEDRELVQSISASAQVWWDENQPLHIHQPEKSVLRIIKDTEVRSSKPEVFHDLFARKHFIFSVVKDECDFRKALTTKVERYGNLLEMHDQSISSNRHDPARAQYGSVSVLLEALNQGLRGRILYVPPFPTPHLQYPVDKLFCSATIAFEATQSRGPLFRLIHDAAPDQNMTFATVFLCGAFSGWQMPPNGQGVILTVEAGEIYLVLCSSSTEELADTNEFLRVEPGRARILDEMYEAILLADSETVTIHPGSMYFIYGSMSAVCRKRYFYSAATMQKTQLALTHTFIQGVRLCHDVGTLAASRKLLGRMIIFWNDVLIEGKVPSDDSFKFHVPSFHSFSSTLSFFSAISLCIYINAYDSRSYQWLFKSHNVNQLSQDDRRFYAFVRGIAMRLGTWFFKNYELINIATQTVVDGEGSFWIPNLALQACALYRYKIAADKEHPVFATTCEAEDLKEQLIDCVELFDNGKECFNAYIKSGASLPLPLAWNNDGVTYENGSFMRFNLLGQNHTVVYTNDTQEADTLPPDLMPINFALKRVSMSVTAWSDLDRNGAIDHFNTNQHDAQSLSQAATILLDLRIQDVDVAKETIQALKPDRWPVAAIANRLLRVLENLLYEGRAGGKHNPRAERVFSDEKELILYIDGIMDTCRKMVSTKIDKHLKTFLDSKSPVNVVNADLQKACDLLAFVSAEDSESIISVLSKLPGLTMPVNGVSVTVSKLLVAEAPAFFKAIRDEMESRVKRTAPHPFPNSAKRESPALNGHESPESEPPITPERKAAELGHYNRSAMVYKSTSSPVGNGPATFKWWNIRAGRVLAHPDELKLVETPEPGDVLVYYCDGTNQASAWVYYSFGWQNVSGSYFSNLGTVTHPVFSDGKEVRYLAWKSESNRSPTWVKASSIAAKKKYPPLVGYNVMENNLDGPAPSASTSGFSAR
ncbi:hypothetical protein EST38_g9954 [Candolleomyces aberdarensis]|uniref:Uncharacterized protein n=1 Tax=Candolleomyces aberdarensis TaxID=2316362 RepID=A0A4Q2D8N5_9AGAR|nr:hypothetical protein EST38_g9954 [Candolleomyces aberdarensis]